MLQEQDPFVPCVLRQELELHPGPADILDNPTWTIHDPVSGQFFRIGWKEFEILSRWHMGDAQKILDAMNHETVFRTSESDLVRMDKFLRASFLGRPELADLPRHEQVREMKLMNLSKALKSYLFFKIPLCRPDRFLDWVHPCFKIFFTRTFVWMMLILSFFSLGLIVRQWDSFLSTFVHFFSFKGLVVYAAAIILSKIIHEFAHAITARHYGVRVTTLGVAILVLWPLLYTDTSDSWKLVDKRKRMAISGAGIISELVLASVAGLLWVVFDDGPWRSACFLLASTNWITTILFNMNPFMRFDGYFILSDYLNMENMQPRAFAYTGWRISEFLFRFGDPSPEKIPKRLEKPLMFYAVSTWIYRIGLIASISMIVYHLLFKAVGVILLAVQLYQSVFTPLSKKAGKVFARRKEIRLLKSNVAVSIILLGVIGTFFLPLNSSIRAQGLLKDANRSLLHAVDSGRMENVFFKDGDNVEVGDVLFSLASPELEYRINTALLRMERYKRELESHGFDARRKEYRLVLLAELEREKSAYEALLKKKDKLTVRTPVNGILELREDQLLSGEWVGAGAYLGTVVDTSSAELTAFVSELDVHRIKDGAGAVFYPDLAEYPPVKARLVSMEDYAITELKEPAFASVHGGEMAVTHEKERLLPLQTFYRVTLKPLNDPFTTLPFELGGTLVIEAKKQSLAERFFKKVYGLLIRESVF